MSLVLRPGVTRDALSVVGVALVTTALVPFHAGINSTTVALASAGGRMLER